MLFCTHEKRTLCYNVYKVMSSAFVARSFSYFCCGIGTAAEIYDVVLL